MHDSEEIDIGRNVLEANSISAEHNRKVFAEYRILAVNIMGPPGSGKTTLLERTVKLLPAVKVAVIEGDIEGDVDQKRVLAAGASQAYQINTFGACHLIAHQVEHALEHLELADIDLLFIENIGNLVCPAEFDLGESAKVMVIGVTEGADKPLKYPLMFHKSQAVVINKIDIVEQSGCNIDELKKNIRRINPYIKIFEVSSRTGQGLDAWARWVSGEDN
jgi:hydrogenase nickel incorporation protein HypB